MWQQAKKTVIQWKPHHNGGAYVFQYFKVYNESVGFKIPHLQRSYLSKLSINVHLFRYVMVIERCRYPMNRELKWRWNGSKRLHPRAGFGASCLVWRLLYWMLHAVQRRVDEFNTESKGTTSLFQSNRMNFPNGGWPTALFWKLSGVFLGSKIY